MAKLFSSDNVPEFTSEEERFEIKTISDRFFKVIIFGFLASLAITIGLIFHVFVFSEEKKEENKKENMEKLVDILVMDNGNILTQKVKYETSKKVDPDDTSEIFFEVVSGNDTYQKGDLVKFTHKYFNEISIEGEIYCSMDATQIQCHLKKEHVKESLLKRQ